MSVPGAGHSSLLDDLQALDSRVAPGFGVRVHQTPQVMSVPGAGRSSLLDNLQALDASRSYVPGSLWAGLANGRGNFTDGVHLTLPPEPSLQVPSFTTSHGSLVSCSVSVHWCLLAGRVAHAAPTTHTMLISMWHNQDVKLNNETMLICGAMCTQPGYGIAPFTLTCSPSAQARTRSRSPSASSCPTSTTSPSTLRCSLQHNPLFGGRLATCSA